MRKCIILLGLLFPAALHAHVGYVVDERTMLSERGTDFAYLFSPLSEPVYIALILGVLAASLVFYVLVSRSAWCMDRVSIYCKRAGSYENFLPWLLRISLGIALIGAGGARVLISELVPHMEMFAFLQVALGFLLFTGLLLTPAAIASLVLFCIALSVEPLAIGNAEFAGATLAFLLLGDSRPGVDDVLGIRSWRWPQRFKEFAPLVLRTGIGIAMISMALFEKFMNPHLSAAVVSQYALTDVVPVSDALWVFGAGAAELAIGCMLLFGLRTRLAALIALGVLSLTFFFFEEAVFSHVTLFGVLAALMVTGSGKYSLDGILGSRLHSELRIFR